jgi:chromosome segregation ATPase
MNAELTHDILARKIGQKVSAEDKQIRKMEHFVRENYELFLERGQNAFLSAEDLEYIKPILDKMSLPLEEKEYLENSESYQKKNRILKNLGFVLLAIVLIALVGSGVKNFIDYESALKLTEKERGELGKLESEIKETREFIEAKETEKEIKQNEIQVSEDELKKGEEEKKKAEAEIKVVQEELKKGEEDKKKAELEIAKLKEEQVNLKKSLELSIERAKLLPAKMKEAEAVMKSGDVVKQKEFFKEMAQDESRWSEYLGQMNWEKAKEIIGYNLVDFSSTYEK